MQVSREMTLTVGGTGSIGLAVGTVPVGTVPVGTAVTPTEMPFKFEELHSSNSLDWRSAQDEEERDASAEQNDGEGFISEVVAAEKLALLALYF